MKITRTTKHTGSLSPKFRYAGRKIITLKRVGVAMSFISAALCITDACAQVTILVQNLGQPLQNIIVDPSSVYWINAANNTVQQTNKTTPGSPVYSFAVPNTLFLDDDIVQDTSYIYFGAEVQVNNTLDLRIYKGSKTSHTLTELIGGQVNGHDQVTLAGLAINPSGTPLYFPGYDNAGNLALRSVPTAGGTPATLAFFGQEPWPEYMSTDSAYVHLSINSGTTGAIFRVPFAGGSLEPEVSDPTRNISEILTPSTGPAGGYVFYIAENNGAASLFAKAPGGMPITLVSGISGYRCFTVVGASVYCSSFGAIVKVPINGGPPVNVVTVADAGAPFALDSDGTYIYWTAAGNGGSVRRVAIPNGTPAPTPTPTATPRPTATPTPGVTPSPPVAHTASFVANSSFTANWTHVSGATGYRVDVSTSSSFTSYVPGYQNLNVGNTISRAVTGLPASTTYHYRVRAYNGFGTSINSNVINVTTLSATGAPVAITNPATLIASLSATLNGSVDPHGLATTIYFQYGTTTSYGHTTASQSKNGNSYQGVIANITGLTANTTYHFRVIASNSGGTRYGSDKTFTTLSATGPPIVITNPATNLTSSSAMLNGQVDPHGLTTSIHFQYGRTTTYGSTTANLSHSGNTYSNVSANIVGLSPNTTYHFRAVATNTSGTAHGADKTFTTP
jgi:fibronectin type III domain protein